MSGRILIIDDEPYNVNILSIFLSSLRYEIFIAENGTEALSMMEETAPDLILLDVMMPDITGFEIYRRWMEQSDFDTPVIFLSANAQKADILQGLQLGAFDYLTKPFDLDLLERKIAIALEQKKKLRSLKNDNKQLSELAYIDSLTGLYNRAYLDLTMQTIRDGIRSFHAALMVDMDHFKPINDTYGHLVGDQVLKEVADLLFSRLDPNRDIAFRYGGDEYLILLQDEAGCLELADSIIKAVDDLKIAVSPHKHLKVSVSIGVTHNFDHRSFDQMIAQADSALLGAKNRGRHRVTVY